MAIKIAMQDLPFIIRILIYELLRELSEPSRVARNGNFAIALNAAAYRIMSKIKKCAHNIDSP